MFKNIAYIDGQNLYFATNKHPTNPWSISLPKFREYLTRKYNVITDIRRKIQKEKGDLGS